MTNYKFGEVILVDFLQSGNGYRKKRPALIILDTGDADIILAPITTKERSGRGDYKIRDWSSGGLLRESWVRLAKVTCLDKSDITGYLGQLTNYDKAMLTILWQRLYTF
ncbi:MAG: type II toxin-antitoxin system PemK/MazF family toxin [bacterium]|nr:type II toxin-antitoxin system PemK/MazF family toxin [bacterium]